MIKCFTCGDSGMKIVHRQNDIVPNIPYSEYSRTIYASTLYEICECRIIRSEVIWPPTLPQKI